MPQRGSKVTRKAKKEVTKGHLPVDTTLGLEQIGLVMPPSRRVALGAHLISRPDADAARIAKGEKLSSLEAQMEEQ